MGSLTDKQIEKEKKKAMQEALKAEKERAKADRARLKAEMEEERGRRRLLAEAARDSKPGECIKVLLQSLRCLHPLFSHLALDRVGRRRADQ